MATVQTTSPQSTSSRPAPLIDIAIVGGGVAGAYTAYRLMQAGPKNSPVLTELLQKSGKGQLDVELFEISDRIGGRLWSYQFPGMEDLPADLGGHGFCALQENVYGLCTQELDLDSCPASAFNNPHFTYLRGDWLRLVEEFNPECIPYSLNEEEKKWKIPLINFMDYALQRIVPEIEDTIKDIVEKLKTGKCSEAFKRRREMAEFLRSARFKGDAPEFTGKPFYDIGLWNALEGVLSTEAYQLLAESSFALSIVRNFNLYDSLLNSIDFAAYYHKSEQPWLKLKNGYQELPKTLVDRFEKKGGSVHLRTKLYSLKLEEHGGERFIALTVGAPNVSIIYARYVVLALPKRALELLDLDSLIPQNSQFRADMNSVTPTPATKLFLQYGKPWWEKPGAYGTDKVPPIESGFSTTDLPLRACYYMGAREDKKRALLLASFSDDVVTQFWKGFLDESRLSSSEKSLQAPCSMVMAARRQLEEMHGIKKRGTLPEPLAAVFYSWDTDPFGGGWHNWNPHVRSWEVMPRIRQPVPGVNVFLCGEAYSATQGWVEGALNTAEMVLKTYFGLPQPCWIHPDYDIGP